MGKNLPAAERRAQLIEAALTIAAEHGVAALTTRPMAAAAGVSVGVVHYHFTDKDTLLTHLGETQILQVNDVMRAAFGQYTGWADRARGPLGFAACGDPRAVADHRIDPRSPIADLRDHRPRIAPTQRRQPGGRGDRRAAVPHHGRRNRRIPHPVREPIRCQWTTPVDQVARFALACMNGVVLRWLVDRDSAAALTALDDLVQILATEAG
ncbi:putative TetR family transcriptional regulator [Rhodococcus opacus B4]|uniref:Putative TetR family transcriptional regulator n=1 Tax=Rhodococcus opacus (strain B4) TaxID=632772 RepID=C1B706_RHOOB|nr:putative TetR family transcriptional regulator [Rhodococcus opacus B4]